MYELTNDQRICFGLIPIDSGWTRLEPKPSLYDAHTTVAYLEGTTVRKYIAGDSNLYVESEMDAELSEDFRYLLPKTPKGKPVLLTAAALQKRTGFGMCLSYVRHSNGATYIDLSNLATQKAYYANHYEDITSYGRYYFQNWVESWCAETAPEDLADISRFAAQPRQHVKFREGDVFRFKLNRRLYGYGRILVDYSLMRRKKEPFWDILMGKPVVCGVYRIATERKDMTVAELEKLPSLPSCPIMDNALYYGEFEIIGNIPITDREDYPIFYGNSIDARSRGLRLQCGKLYIRKDEENALCNDFLCHSIGFYLRLTLPVLLACIEANSNDPYWEKIRLASNDLRNPKNRESLLAVCSQLNLPLSQLLLSESTP